ncbi:MAG: hypothetical protein RJQ09_20055 [Cyclobacteriaceae bacterium]
MVLLLVTVLMYSIVQTLNIKNEAIENQHYFPNLRGIDLDNSLTSTHELEKNTSYNVLIRFNTDCYLCEFQLNDLIQLKRYFHNTNTNIFLISTEPLHQLRAYNNLKKIHELPNLHVLRVDENSGLRFFGGNGVPHTLIYGPSDTLIYEYKGLVDVEIMLGYLEI